MRPTSPMAGRSRLRSMGRWLVGGVTARILNYGEGDNRKTRHCRFRGPCQLREPQRPHLRREFHANNSSSIHVDEKVWATLSHVQGKQRPATVAVSSISFAKSATTERHASCQQESCFVPAIWCQWLLCCLDRNHHGGSLTPLPSGRGGDVDVLVAPSRPDLSTSTGETPPIIGGRHTYWAASTQQVSHRRGVLQKQHVDGSCNSVKPRFNIGATAQSGPPPNGNSELQSLRLTGSTPDQGTSAGFQSVTRCARKARTQKLFSRSMQIPTEHPFGGWRHLVPVGHDSRKVNTSSGEVSPCDCSGCSGEIKQHDGWSATGIKSGRWGRCVGRQSFVRRNASQELW